MTGLTKRVLLIGGYGTTHFEFTTPKALITAGDKKTGTEKCTKRKQENVKGKKGMAFFSVFILSTLEKTNA